MLTRTQVFDTLEKMPEQFSIDQLFDKLLFINKVEIGLAQSENGQVNSKEQAKQKLSKWGLIPKSGDKTLDNAM